MALAPFLDKITQSASSMLAGFNPTAFTSQLSRQRVGLIVDAQAAASVEGRVTAELALDLLARLYPIVDVVPLGTGGGQEALACRLLTVARQINPLIEGGTSVVPGTTAALVVGNTPVPSEIASMPLVYIGSDGWLAKASTDGPVGSCNSTNPFGAGAAACIGAANAFRAVFGAQLTRSDLDRQVTLSLLDYEIGTSSSHKNPPLPDVIDLGETYLVGVGAVGHAAVWAWRLSPGLSGTLHLIDDENYDDTNPQRYVVTSANGMPSRKVDYATAVLREGLSPRLILMPHAIAWDEFLGERNDWRLDRVALALDSAEDRIIAQASLPRRIFNSWTQEGNLGVSRHDFLTTACVGCLYLPVVEGPDLDDLIAGALNFPAHELRVVRFYLDTAAPLDRDMLTKIAQQVGIPEEVLHPFEGMPLLALYHRAVCGGTILRFGGNLGGAVREAEVPMAFQSALAGIMLAAEIVIDAAGLRPVMLPVRTEIDLRRPLSGTLCSPESKHQSGRCICQDPDFISSYRVKYDMNGLR